MNTTSLTQLTSIFLINLISLVYSTLISRRCCSQQIKRSYSLKSTVLKTLGCDKSPKIIINMSAQTAKMSIDRSYGFYTKISVKVAVQKIIFYIFFLYLYIVLVSTAPNLHTIRPDRVNHLFIERILLSMERAGFLPMSQRHSRFT